MAVALNYVRGTVRGKVGQIAGYSWKGKRPGNPRTADHAAARTKHSTAACYRSLAAAVVNKALDDLKGGNLFLSSGSLDRAMAFVDSETCAAYCSFVGIDHEAVRKKAAALYRQAIKKKPWEWQGGAETR